MKKRFALTIAALGTAMALMAPPAHAAVGPRDTKQACVDVKDGSGTYARTTSTVLVLTQKENAGHLTMNVTLWATPCKNATYIFEVWNDETQSSLIWRTSTPTSVNGATFTYDVDLPVAGGNAPTNDYVCVDSITMLHGTVMDQAPDPGSGSNNSGCVDVYGPPSGGSYF